MMHGFESTLPATSRELLDRLYQGALFVIPATERSREFVDQVWDEIEATFGREADPRMAQFSHSPESFFEKAGGLRRKFYTESSYHTMVATLIRSFGFDLNDNGFDAARLRAVSHAGHEIAAAAPMYYGHRDTWYANPQSMITWWIPLHDVAAEETFEFYPNYFGEPVDNDSEIFDFDQWVESDQKKLIGWQDQATGLTAKYPRLLQTVEHPGLSVVGRRGDVLLFSGQHLHQTRKQMTGKTRFSIDFRTVQFSDHNSQIGAVNVDNRSKGSWISKFVRLSNV